MKADACKLQCWNNSFGNKKIQKVKKKTSTEFAAEIKHNLDTLKNAFSMKLLSFKETIFFYTGLLLDDGRDGALQNNIQSVWKVINITQQEKVKTKAPLATDTRARCCKTFFMLNSVEHEIFPANKY